MRWMFAVFALCVGGCSVYDEDLLSQSPQRITTARAPDEAGSAAATMALPTDAGTVDTSPDARAAQTCVLHAPGDYCAALPSLPEPPRIDGTLECGLTLSPIQPLGWSGAGAEPDKTASYAAAWHRDGLYVYVEVHGGATRPHPPGQPIFCGDAVELYVDADAETDDAGTYDSSGTMQFVVAAPSATAPMDAFRFIQGAPQGAWISPSLRVTPLADGFSVEALITGADIGLWEWHPNMQLGFSIVIDVAGSTGLPTREGCTEQSGQFFLRLGAPHGSCPGEPWCDARAFCQAQLLE